MKPPDEIKKGLLCCSHSDMPCSQCPYDGICNTDSGETPEDDAVGLIDQLLSTYSQVSKALCGKGNATPEELLQAASQLKSRLAQAERERDAAVEDIERFFVSPEVCMHYKYCQSVTDDPSHGCLGPMDCMDYKYRGLCEENTKEDSTC